MPQPPHLRGFPFPSQRAIELGEDLIAPLWTSSADFPLLRRPPSPAAMGPSRLPSAFRPYATASYSLGNPPDDRLASLNPPYQCPAAQLGLPDGHGSV